MHVCTYTSIKQVFPSQMLSAPNQMLCKSLAMRDKVWTLPVLYPKFKKKVSEPKNKAAQMYAGEWAVSGL